MRRSLTSAVAVFLVACMAPDRPVSPFSTSQQEVGRQISDAVHSGGNARFYFLPPMVPAPSPTGVFDAALSPEVEVCEWNGSCGVSIAHFSAGSGSSNARVDATAEHYIVNWDTKECSSGPCELDPAKTYRIRVVAGAVELGFADVDVVTNGSQLKNVQTNEYIGLVEGRTLPVKFRIEQGIVGLVTVAPNPAEVERGQSIQLVETVSDLHGDPITGRTVTWSSTDQGIASIGGDGVATGIAVGCTTMVATVEGVSGSTPLCVTAPPMTVPPTIVASMNDPRYSLAVAETNGRVFAISGYSDVNGFTNRNESYDPTANQWSYRAAAPTSRWYPASAAVNGIIYVMGGNAGGGCCNTVTTIEAFDPASNTWTTKAPMPFSREQFSATAYNGLIYVIGGWRPGQGYLTSVQAYDPISETWTSIAPMPQPRGGHAVAVADGKLYVVGGEGSGGFLASTLEYDPASNTWTVRANIPTARTLLAAVAVDGVVYAIGGWLRGNNGGLSEIEAYDPATDSWSTKPPLNIARFALGAVAVNGTIYVAGGLNQVKAVGPAEMYRP